MTPNELPAKDVTRFQRNPNWLCVQNDRDQSCAIGKRFEVKRVERLPSLTCDCRQLSGMMSLIRSIITRRLRVRIVGIVRAVWITVTQSL